MQCTMERYISVNNNIIDITACKALKYRMAGNFQGSQLLRFSQLTGHSRNLNLRNKSLNVRSCEVDMRDKVGGVAIVVNAISGLI